MFHLLSVCLRSYLSVLESARWTQLYRGWFAIYVKLSYTKPQNKVWFLSCLINYSIAQLYQQYLTLSYNNSPEWCHGGCGIRHRRCYANTLDNKIPSLLLKVDFGVLLFSIQMKAPNLSSCASYFTAISFFLTLPTFFRIFYLYFNYSVSSCFLLLQCLYAFCFLTNSGRQCKATVKIHL